MLKLGPALCRITRFWFRVGRLVLGPAPADMLSSMLLLHAARLCVARRLLPKEFTLPFTVSSRTTFPPWVHRRLWNRHFLWPTPPKRSWCGAPLGASLWCVASLHYSAIQASSELKTSQPDGGKGAMVRRLVHLDISNYEPPHTSACTGTRREA